MTHDEMETLTRIVGILNKWSTTIGYEVEGKEVDPFASTLIIFYPLEDREKTNCLDEVGTVMRLLDLVITHNKAHTQSEVIEALGLVRDCMNYTMTYQDDI